MPWQQYSREVTAKSLLLDLVRAIEPKAMPVSLLVNAGSIFSISENAIRVNITRLVANGQIEADERGYYRVGPETTPRRTWINQWQDGEARVKLWQGDWLLMSLSPSLKTKEIRSLEHICSRLGFRCYSGEAWIRPNNLTIAPFELANQIAKLGGSRDFVLSLVSEIYQPGPNEVSDLQDLSQMKALWQSDKVEKQYRDLIEALEIGIKQSESATVESLFETSYLLGGEVIHTLVIDPLLPEEMIDVNLRARLTELMKEYDECHRPAWDNFFQANKFDTPSRNREVGLYAQL